MRTKACPVCRQPLPESIDEEVLHSRLHDLAAPLLKDQTKRVQEEARAEYRQKYESQVASVREQAQRSAQRDAKAKIEELRRDAAAARLSAEKANRMHANELQQVRREIQEESRQRELREMERLEREAERRERQTRQTFEREFEKRALAAEAKRDQERNRLDVENKRLQKHVSDLSRQLEKTQSEQLGEEAEIDLFSLLQSEFPEDRIKRIGKGIKGADIVHTIFTGSREIGCIVYESKNVRSWSNSFISKAKACQRQYSTPYVLVVTRAMPRNERGLCVMKDVHVVEPHMALSLATIIRDAVVALGSLAGSNEGREGKAHLLFNYILSDEFATRFKSLADSVAELRVQQERERDWHENAWQARNGLHDRLESARREVSSKIKNITNIPTRSKLRMAVAG